MPISQINRAKTIAVSLSASSGNQIINIYNNSGLLVGSELTPGYTVVSHNCFVKNLKAFSVITSLPEIGLPNFELTDSETTKLYKTLDIEWKSARKQLNLFVGVNNNWYQAGSTSILNPSGYPFRIYSLLDMLTDNLYFELGENGKIGVQVQDVGHGLLAGSDSIVIHGSYVEEIFVKSPEQIYTTVPTNTPSGTSSNQPTSPPSNPPANPPTSSPTSPPTSPPTNPGESMSYWMVKTEDYTASNNDKILVSAPNGETSIILPDPIPGNEIRIIKLGENTVNIVFGSNTYQGATIGGIAVPFANREYVLVAFDFGAWMGTLPLITN